MPLASPADAIQVPGKVEILIAVENAYSDLFKLGESENGIQVRIENILSPVYGDRYGGNEGEPIEEQFLGKRASFQLQMSRWDPAQVTKIERLGTFLAAEGTIPLASIGALVQAAEGIRVLLYCIRQPSLSRNFPCCVFNTPMEYGRGTKYSSMSIGVTARRAPEGYWNTGSVGKLYDADTTGIPDPYVPS